MLSDNRGRHRILLGWAGLRKRKNVDSAVLRAGFYERGMLGIIERSWHGKKVEHRQYLLWKGIEI